MRFSAFELGRFTGRPVRLFVFTRQHLTWRFANSDRDIVSGGFTYLAARIDRSDIQHTTEREKDQITITFPYLLNPAADPLPVTQELGNQWRPYHPVDVIRVVCMVMHVGDTDPPQVEWMGRVIQPRFSDTEMELTCAPHSSIALAHNQGAKFQSNCWKTVYSTGLRGCNLSTGEHRVTGRVARIEQLPTDPPQGAHVLVPDMAAHLASLVGQVATWTYEAQVPHSGTVASVINFHVRFTRVTDIAIGAVLHWTAADGIAHHGTVTALFGTVAVLNTTEGITAGSVCHWSLAQARQGTATIMQAYHAYDWVSQAAGGSSSGFSWDDASGLHDAHSGTAWSVTYTTRSALVLSDVTGLEEGSGITVVLSGSAVSGRLSAVAGLQLTATQFASAAYSLEGGTLTYTDANGLLIRRSIASHTLGSATLTLSAGGPNPVVNDAVTVLPTCPRTWDACAARGNTIHFGGAVYRPLHTPEGVSMSWG